MRSCRFSLDASVKNVPTVGFRNAARAQTGCRSNSKSNKFYIILKQTNSDFINRSKKTFRVLHTRQSSWTKTSPDRCLTCCNGESAGKRKEFWAFKDLPTDSNVLGIEIRNNSVKAAVIETSTGRFVGSGAQTKLEGVTELSLSTALQRMTKEQFKWKGLVGCSITKAVARGLGVDTPSFSLMDREVGRILREMLPSNTVITMIHTEAGGYAELAYGEHEFENELVLVVTVGRALGAVLYKDGHRVRNTGMNSKYTADWEADTDALEAVWPKAFPKTDAGRWGGLPEPVPPGEEGSEAWKAFLKLAVDTLLSLCQYARPDALLLMPTGELTRQPDVMEAIRASFQQASQGALDYPMEVSLSGSGGAIVKGAAVGAIVEVKVTDAIAGLRSAVDDQVVMLQRLTGVELRAVFDIFDRDADGKVSISEIAHALGVMGVEVAQPQLEQMLSQQSSDGSSSTSGLITFSDFHQWWQSRVKSAPVTKITSADEFRDILNDSGDQKLVVLEIGFTFCRPCKAFETKFERLALQYPGAAFVRINGNENRSTIELCRDELMVERTPTFVLWRNGEEIHRHTGIDIEKFHEMMADQSEPLVEVVKQ